MKKWAIAGLALLVGVGALFTIPIILLAAILAGSAAGGCLPPEEMAAYDGPGVEGLTPLQMQRAAAVVAEGRRSGIPDQGIVIALAVASQESRFKVYANDGKGGDLAGDQQGIERSLQYPHDAVGTDHGSLGIFQQQWPWWGTMEELMDPQISARKFYDALRQVGGWESMELTVAAQTVQRSAFPDAYADDEPLARSLLTALGPTIDEDEPPSDEPENYMESRIEDAGAVITGTPDCAVPVAAAGVVVYPVPAGSGYVDQHNYGKTGPNWSTYHTGTDFSVACGTPVLASHSGKVIVRTDQSWSGPWLVQIQSRPGGLTTWYAHMQKLSVADGATVTAGQQIGEVGTEGNSTGCHLHFEVHTRGGGHAEDDVDPSAWLANNVGRDLGVTGARGSFKVATFNALGHSHTRPGGKRCCKWAQYDVRTRGLVRLLGRHKPDVVGLQEFQPAQARVFDQETGPTYGRYGIRDNVIVWRRDTFQLVSRHSFTIPYFQGKHRRMPVTRLRHRPSGTVVSVINVHNPADAHGPAGKWRREAIRIERAEVAREQAAGRPVLLVGDLNDRAPAFCGLTAGGLMTSPAGGSNIGSCAPPQRMQIDWIFGAVTNFTGYQVDRSPKGKISDHPYIHSTVSLGADLPPGGQDTTTLLTYNIKHGSGGLERIAQEIAASGAAVVALQEADNRRSGPAQQHIEWLARRLDMQATYAVNGTWRGKPMIDNAILSKYPITEAENTRLPGTADSQPRGLLRAQVALPGGKPIEVYATHLHFKGRIRMAQAKAVRDEVGTPNCATAAMGDLNFTPGKPMYDVVTAALRDAFAGGKFGAGRTVPVTDPRARIDYILHSRRIDVVAAQVMPAGASDHRGVRATLHFDPEDYC